MILVSGPIVMADEVVFINQGKLATDTTSYLLVGKIEIDSVLEDLRWVYDIKELIQEVYDKIPKTHKEERKLIKSQLYLLSGELNGLLKKVHDFKHLSTPVQDEETPQKRSILAIAGLAGLSLGNLAYSAHLHHQISNWEERQSKLHHYVDVTAALAKENDIKIGILNNTVRQLMEHEFRFQEAVINDVEALQMTQRTILLLSVCSEAISQVTATLQHLTNAWNSLLEGHVTTEVMSPRVVKNELKKIKNRIPSPLDLAIAINEPLNFYKLPGYMVSKDGKMLLVIPVPIYNVNELYSIYKHVPTPVLLDDELEVIVEVRNTLLVTNDNYTRHQEISREDLDECLVVGKIFICPNRKIFENEEKKSCLILLKKGLYEMAHKYCHRMFRLYQNLDIVTKGPNEYIIISTKENLIKQHCRNETRMFMVTPGRTLIKVPEGCSFETNYHYVSPTRNHSLSEKSFEFQINSNAAFENYSAIMNVKTLSEKIGFSPKDTLTLIKDLAKFNNRVTADQVTAAAIQARHNYHPFMSLSIVAIVVASVGACFICMFLTWLGYKWKTDPETNNAPERPG